MHVLAGTGRGVYLQAADGPPELVLESRGVRDLTFVGDRAFFLAHRSGAMDGRLFLGDPVRGRLTGKAYFTASRGLKTPGAE